MTKGGSGPPAPFGQATLPTISDVQFGFHTGMAESLALNPIKIIEKQSRLLANDDAYRKTVSPKAWS
jgi:hypothetical protein